MARKKNSGFGAVAVVIGFFAMLVASIHKEVWITVGVIAIAGVVIYIFAKNKSSSNQSQVHQNKPLIGQAVQQPVPVSPTRAGVQQRSSSYGDSWRDDSPVTVAPPASASSSYRIPAAPKGYGQATWLAKGQSTTVGSVAISGGMLYVGTVLKTRQGSNDPCLIDPTKNVASSGSFTERQTNYWPSYSEISAPARRAYLNWLADGRKHAEADIGYVFLYFYGLERRAILDAATDKEAQADWPAIAQELRRLLGIYGEKSNSFQRYAGELLSWIELASHPAKIYEKPIPEFPRTSSSRSTCGWHWDRPQLTECRCRPTWP